MPNKACCYKHFVSCILLHVIRHIAQPCRLSGSGWTSCVCVWSSISKTTRHTSRWELTRHKCKQKWFNLTLKPLSDTFFGIFCWHRCNVFMSIPLISLWVTPGTVSHICGSSKKPSRDSTPVTRTADWANWRTCCRTPWYLIPHTVCASTSQLCRWALSMLGI